MSFDFHTVFPGEIFVMLVMALVATVPGFFRYRSFRGLGFYLAIIAQSAYLLAYCIVENKVSVVGVLFFLGLIVYAALNVVSDHFGEKVGFTDEEVTKGRKSFGISFLTWIGCSILYTAIFTPLLYRTLAGGMNISSGASSYSITMLGCTPVLWICVLLIAGQLSLSFNKTKTGGKFPMKGFHRFVRYPKELFTLVLWLACFCTVFLFGTRDLQLMILPVVAHVAMIVVQICDLKKKEAVDDATYGDDENYREYVTYTSILIPFIPWNSLQKKHAWEDDEDAALKAE